MIIGGMASKAVASTGGCRAWPCIAASALAGLDAERYGGAECTPTAANNSG